jgi:hypothetical protein
MYLGKLIFVPITGREVSRYGILSLKTNSSLGDWVHSVMPYGVCGGDVSDGGSLVNLYSYGYCNNVII